MADIKEVQKQLDAALAENKSLKEVISTDQGRIESLKAANDSLAKEMEAVVKSRDLLAEEKKALMATLEYVSKGRDELASNNASLQAEVARLIATPDEKETESGVGGIFEVGGSKYQVLVPSYNIPGFGIMTANDLLANTGAQAVLVKSVSGLIKSVK